MICIVELKCSANLLSTVAPQPMVRCFVKSGGMLFCYAGCERSFDKFNNKLTK
jgi:hypothetical protein